MHVVYFIYVYVQALERRWQDHWFHIEKGWPYHKRKKNERTKPGVHFQVFYRHVQSPDENQTSIV